MMFSLINIIIIWSVWYLSSLHLTLTPHPHVEMENKLNSNCLAKTSFKSGWWMVSFWIYIFMENSTRVHSFISKFHFFLLTTTEQWDKKRENVSCVFVVSRINKFISCCWTLYKKKRSLFMINVWKYWKEKLSEKTKMKIIICFIQRRRLGRLLSFYSLEVRRALLVGNWK